MGALLCPRCRLGLFVGQAGGVTMNACGRCGGVWLDNASARKIHEAASVEAVSLADRASAAGTAEVNAAAVAPCPECAKAMARVHVNAANVDVDACSQHGTWFDRGELHAVAEAFSAMRARRGKLVGAAAVVGGVAVAGTAAAVVASQAPAVQSSLSQNASAVLDVAANVGGAVVEVAGDAVADGVVEGAFSLIGGILGAIFDAAS
jgi:Zn-finger nucleic acid-binding protein